MGIDQRKQRERKQRRAVILDAARKIFSQKGFNRATMEEIAEEAEFSTGTIYIYFKNKEELHTLLSIKLLRHLVEKVEEVSSMDIPVQKKMKKFADTFIDIYDYDPSILINLFHLQSGETLQNLSDEILKQIKTYSSISHNAISGVIKQGIDEGLFIKDHPVAMADILWASYAGVVLWVYSKRQLDNNKDFVKPTLKIAFQLINKGIKAA